MGLSSGGEPGDPAFLIPTFNTPSDVPTIIWTDTAGPRVISVEALIWVDEPGIPRADYGIFKFIVKQFADDEGGWSIQDILMDQAASGGMGSAGPYFTLVADQLAIEVIGLTGNPLNWRAAITIRT